MEDMTLRFVLGRPALLETHRSNFIGKKAEFSKNLACVDELLFAASQRWPALSFLSPAALAQIYANKPEEWCAKGFGVRLHILLRRLQRISRLRKLALLTGLALAAALARTLTAPAVRRAGVTV